MMMLVWKNDPQGEGPAGEAGHGVEERPRRGCRPSARSTGMGQSRRNWLSRALDDPDPAVRRHAVRLLEPSTPAGRTARGFDCHWLAPTTRPARPRCNWPARSATGRSSWPCGHWRNSCRNVARPVPGRRGDEQPQRDEPASTRGNAHVRRPHGRGRRRVMIRGPVRDRGGR